jgi:glyoxylase-like metal-dependent hydrolase (beta-lactamase superfamily II)
MSESLNQKTNQNTEIDFGPIQYIRGLNKGRFPNDNSIFIDDDIKVIIDPGSDPLILKDLNDKHKIEYVFNSHYHYDHMRYNFLFKQSKILLHELDAPLFQSIDKLAEAIGLPYLYDKETVEQWKSQLQGGEPYFRGMYNVAYSQEWIWSTERVDGTFKDSDIYKFGDSTMKVIHTPGHSLGMCCFLFPRQRAAYVTDYDLTPFGPWYGSIHSDMEAIITSADKLRNLDGIDWFITSHEMGIFKRNDFLKGLDKFISIISERDEKILEILNNGSKTLDELVRSSIVYNSRHVEDKFTYMWEWLHLEKHLSRLIDSGKIEKQNNKFIIV